MIRAGDIHVWTLDLDQLAEERDASAVLSADELARAQRFHFDLHRRRFVAGRRALRTTLGRYLDAAPADIKFDVNAFGKPTIGGTALRFNFSHSAGAALLGITEHREIGIDIEKVNPTADLLPTARAFFSPDEFAALAAQPEKKRPAAFYHYWTAKEAYVKARGQGLSLALDGFSVPGKSKECFGLLRSEEGPDELRRWTLCSLDVVRGYEATLAVEAGPTQIQFMDGARS